MESSTAHRAFRFRLEPTAGQARAFAQFAGARRWVWNWALAEMQQYYKETGKTLPAGVLSARLTALKDKPETAWLKEMDSQALQQTLIDLRQAFVNFFERRARYPRFKSKKRDRVRFRIPQRVKVVGKGVQVPKIGHVRMRLSQPVVGTTKSATFKQDACGHWFVTLVAECEVPGVELPAPDPERTVGIDLGLKDAVVPSAGPRIPAARFYRRAERTLRRAQRVHSRRKKGSRNRAKARTKVARVHQRVANQRADFLHKITTTLIKNHDAVCTEDLSAKGLARTKLAKSVLDASMGTLRWQLTYKGQWYGTHVVAVDRFFPSTQLCHDCGFKNEHLALTDRMWVCPHCGVLHDRDLNAALNIEKEGLRLLAVLAAGHAESLNACGRAVRPPMTAGPVEARSPRLLPCGVSNRELSRVGSPGPYRAYARRDLRGCRQEGPGSAPHAGRKRTHRG
jgi:putative transposase